MAQRRMFSNRIVGSGRFLTMPPSSQALYFHLGISADDDGAVEAYKIIKLTDSKPDDLRCLVDKGFVTILNDDLVVVILDWREHNAIRADRKIDSIYKTLILEKLPQYTLLPPKQRADTGKLSGRQMDVQMSAQDRIGKVRVGKDNKGKNILFWKDQKCHISPINGKIGMYDQGEWKELNENYPEDCKLIDPNGEVLATGYEAITQFKK